MLRFWTLAYFTVLIVGVVGWVSNIVIMIGQMDETFTGEFLLRMLGIVLVPLGAVMGYV